MPLGAGEVRFALGNYKTNASALSPTAQKVALYYVHNLSRRTTDLGLRHSF